MDTLSDLARGNGKPILVVGGLGFIGSRVMHHLQEQNVPVEFFDTLESAGDESVVFRRAIAQGIDITKNQTECFNNLKDYTAVIMTKGPARPEFWADKTQDQISSHINRSFAWTRTTQIPVIYMGSCSIYDGVTKLPASENELHVYQASLSLRSRGKMYAYMKLIEDYELNPTGARSRRAYTATLRLNAVYGPDDSHERLVPSLLRHAARGTQPEKLTHHPVHLTHLDDVAEAITSIVMTPRYQQNLCVNYCNERATTPKMLWKYISALYAGKEAELEYTKPAVSIDRLKTGNWGVPMPNRSIEQGIKGLIEGCDYV